MKAFFSFVVLVGDSLYRRVFFFYSSSLYHLPSEGKVAFASHFNLIVPLPSSILACRCAVYRCGVVDRTMKKQSISWADVARSLKVKVGIFFPSVPRRSAYQCRPKATVLIHPTRAGERKKNQLI